MIDLIYTMFGMEDLSVGAKMFGFFVVVGGPIFVICIMLAVGEAKED